VLVCSKEKDSASTSLTLLALQIQKASGRINRSSML
jgi:hypothetical protein